MITPRELEQLVAQLAPPDLAEEWDNVGLLLDSGEPTDRILFALDATAQAVEEAKKLGCGIIVTHHPLIFQPLRRIEAGSPVQIIYAGSPGGKDSLRPLLAALLSLSDSLRARLHLHIVGISEEQMTANGILGKVERDTLRNALSVYGRVPHDTVEQMLKQMDFSVLLRPAQERYAKAGFPTKVVEAMSHGVAMVCNLSSDLSDYLTDGKNAILASGEDEASVRTALQRLAALDDITLLTLRKNARKTALQCFDYRGYAAAVTAFAGISRETEADA